MFIGIITLIIALCLSITSAYFSTIGLTAIFPAAVVPVIIMAIALEFAKIISVVFLHNHWNRSPFLIKFYLVSAVIILMSINSLGIFGLLSKAHISQEVQNDSQMSQTEVIQSKIDNENEIINDDKKEIDQINSGLSKLIDQGKVQTSIFQSNAQRKNRDNLQADKDKHLEVLQKLKEQKIDADNNNAKIASDFGPLLYIADAFYGQATKFQLESTVRWIITIIVLVFDPLALVLLVASQFSLNFSKKDLQNPSNNGTFAFDEDKANL